MVKYHNYQDLRVNESEGVDYQIHLRHGQSGIAVMAPHGGGIEPGTTEIADAVAGDEHAFYSFEGLKKRGNSSLHITSHCFDEAAGIDLAKNCKTIVTIHGFKDAGEIIVIGGLDKALKEKIQEALRAAGFIVREDSDFPGKSAQNICNRSRRGVGVQLEISLGLRRLMFRDLARVNRGDTTDLFELFVSALRLVLEDIR
jgi:phage replication-related protein YjqB (UPF0714/DUF867 family)